MKPETVVAALLTALLALTGVIGSSLIAAQRATTTQLQALTILVEKRTIEVDLRLENLEDED